MEAKAPHNSSAPVYLMLESIAARIKNQRTQVVEVATGGIEPTQATPASCVVWRLKSEMIVEEGSSLKPLRLREDSLIATVLADGVVPLYVAPRGSEKLGSMKDMPKSMTASKVVKDAIVSYGASDTAGKNIATMLTNSRPSHSQTDLSYLYLFGATTMIDMANAHAMGACAAPTLSARAAGAVSECNYYRTIEYIMHLIDPTIDFRCTNLMIS